MPLEILRCMTTTPPTHTHTIRANCLLDIFEVALQGSSMCLMIFAVVSVPLTSTQGPSLVAREQPPNIIRGRGTARRLHKEETEPVVHHDCRLLIGEQ